MNTNIHRRFSRQSNPHPKAPANDNSDLLSAAHVNGLAVAAAAGEGAAVAKLADQYGAAFLRVARRYALNEQDAEEALQSLLAYLLEGRAIRFAPKRGGCFDYLLDLLRSLARRARADAQGQARARECVVGAPPPDEDDDFAEPRSEPGSLFDPYDPPEDEDEEEEGEDL